MATTQEILAQSLLKQGADPNTDFINRGLASFLGARSLKRAEDAKQEKLRRQSGALSEALLATGANPDVVEALALGDDVAGLRKALMGRLQPAKPFILSPGEQAFSQGGERIAQVAVTPPSAKEEAQTRKFSLEADVLKRNLAKGATPKDLFNSTQKLRKEFTGLSDVFLKQRDAFTRIEASASDPSAAGDLALIFNYMKLLDPGSTVREGEFATAQNSAGVPDQIRARFNKVFSGERLAKNTRADFVNRANKLFNASKLQQAKRVRTFSDLATKAGLPADQVAIDLGRAGEVTRDLIFNPTTGRIE